MLTEKIIIDAEYISYISDITERIKDELIRRKLISLDNDDEYTCENWLQDQNYIIIEFIK